jgi:hypothetical protein
MTRHEVRRLPQEEGQKIVPRGTIVPIPEAPHLAQNGFEEVIGRSIGKLTIQDKMAFMRRIFYTPTSILIADLRPYLVQAGKAY